MYGNVRYFYVGHRGALSLRAATKKLEHFQRNHTVEKLDNKRDWCERCALVISETDYARYGSH